MKINNFLSKIKNYKRLKLSSSLKFCILAEKNADFYPRFTVINKWDIAAGHSILSAAGGVLVNFEGKEIKYNSKTIETEKFIAFASKNIMKEFIDWCPLPDSNRRPYGQGILSPLRLPIPPSGLYSLHSYQINCFNPYKIVFFLLNIIANFFNSLFINLYLYLLKTILVPILGGS